MKIIFLIALIFMVLILFCLAGYLLIGFLCYRYALSRKGKMVRKIQKKHSPFIPFREENIKYFKEGYKKIGIVSQDNLKLVGFYKDNNKNKLAILVHGFAGSHIDMAGGAKIFENKDYDILAIDLKK